MGKETSQKERMLSALHPQHFKVDDRSLYDLYEEAQALAEALVFHESSSEEATANWASFFDEAGPYLQKVISEDWKPDKCPPHLGLFITFLKLFGHTQHELNKLTESHLQFFYHKILGQEKKGAKPDRVYVFFELGRNIKKYLLPQLTPLLAGKDNQGNDVAYTTDRKVFLNKAKVTQFKAIRNQKASDGTLYAFPVANSWDGFGAPLKQGQGWHPFGNPKIHGATAEIGLGIGSPMLFLKEGLRTIEISFLLADSSNPVPMLNALDSSEFEVQLTGPDQWFASEVTEIRYQNGRLTFATQLNEVDPPVTAFDKNIHGYRIETMGWPLLKIVLKQGFAYSRYNFVQSLQFTAVTIKVEVEKARSLLIRNDFGALDGSKTFQPFGYSPVKGANLYLGLEETFLKPITRFALHIKWKGLPENFKTYYEGYLGATNSLVRTNEDFKVRAAIRYQRDWFDIKNETENSEDFPLFGNILELSPEEHLKSSPTSYREIENEDGLIRLTLSSPAHAFGHLLYPAVYAKAIMTQLQNKESPIPNEPYTPSIESVELAYTAEEEIDLTETYHSSVHFYHIEPFGIKEIFRSEEKPISSYPLISGEFHHAGSLYLGIENLNPPQQLTVFFELQEGMPQDKPDLTFAYLSKAGWRHLSENQVLSDTTLGLKQTGILLLSLPAGMTSENPIMAEACHWLRISVPEYPENFDRILSVRSNAVSCTLCHEQHYERFEVNSLPPFSIKSFAKKISEIKKIEQPYNSFGGRPSEKEMGYFTRVSEKLRHKMRSITCWDIERLILEQFPEIYKVKCIPHSNANGQHEPGNIHIIVVPIIKQRSRQKILKPLVSNSVLIKIRRYIESLSSPHAKLTVANPHYEEIKIVVGVNFNLQVDAGFYLKRLQKDLQYFLSPWAFQDDVEIQLGSKLYRSSIIAFIESRPYVNFIAHIKLLKNNKVIQDHEISPGAQTIIVSADSHNIEAIGPDSSACQTNQGIAQMIVDINFEVQ